jgi:hypothetical protein
MFWAYAINKSTLVKYRDDKNLVETLKKVTKIKSV